MSNHGSVVKQPSAAAAQAPADKIQALATTGQHAHGSAASKETLEAIIEYAPGFDCDKLPDASAKAQALSKEDGSFTESAGL